MSSTSRKISPSTSLQRSRILGSGSCPTRDSCHLAISATLLSRDSISTISISPVLLQRASVPCPSPPIHVRPLQHAHLPVSPCLHPCQSPTASRTAPRHTMQSPRIRLRSYRNYLAKVASDPRGTSYKCSKNLPPSRRNLVKQKQ